MVGQGGDVFEFSYKDNVMEGRSVYTWANGQVEEAEYRAGLKEGPGVEISPGGDREERTWVAGQLSGPATTTGANGDRLEFCYVKVRACADCAVGDILMFCLPGGEAGETEHQ